MTRLATTANKQRKLVIVTGVIILAATLAASLYLTKRNSYRLQASEALFKARTQLNLEMKSIATALKPAEPAAKPEKDPKAKKAKPAAEAPAIDFAKFDVDAKLAGGVSGLQKVAEEFPNTIAGFDAKMQLGSLYFDHAESPAAYERALQWFDRASASAPSNEQTIAALYNLGFAQEALGRPADAVKTFERALNSGAGPFQGELLQAKARCQEAIGDKAGAKATYETIVKQLPTTEYAKFAEMKKAML